MSNIEFDEYEDSRRLYMGYTIQRTDPYALWIVLDQKGRKVKGVDSFTTPHDAAKALTNLLERTKKKV
jgi:hypothetical protein